MMKNKQDTESVDEKIMRKLLMREEHEFNKQAKDKFHDPQSLKILTSDVTKGYTRRKNIYGLKGLNMEELASSERRTVYLELMARITTALRITERTKY